MINVGGNYYIEADTTSFQFIEWDGTYRTAKDGSKQKANMRYKYYSTFENLLAGLHKAMLRKQISESNDLIELKDKIDQINEIIIGISKGVTPEALLRDRGGM